MQAKYKRIGLELTVVLVILLGLRAYQTRFHLRGALPRTSATTLDGHLIQLGAQSEEPVMLHFWATWCGVCRAEESSVISAGKRVRVISVASRSGSDAEVLRYVRDAGIAFPVINDESGALSRRFGVRAYPTTFFVGRDGVIKTSEVGYTTYLGMLARMAWAGS